MSPNVAHVTKTLYTEQKYENILGSLSVSICKSLIANILNDNGYPVSYDDFVFKIVRSHWTKETTETKFALVDKDGNIDEEESDKVALQMQRERINRECVWDYDGNMLPRVVSVEYSPDLSFSNDAGVMLPPSNPNFGQRGMVINLERGEILCPGISWMKVTDDLETFNEIFEDAMYLPSLQFPIEGASVSVFRDGFDGQIYFGTGHKVVTLEKAFYGGGSRWNFYGRGFEGNSGGCLAMEQNEKFIDIHKATLECVANSVFQYLGITDLPETDSIPSLIKDCLNKTIFDEHPNHVITGILTGKMFAGRSRILSREDVDLITFTPISYVERLFSVGGKKTVWEQNEDVDYLDKFDDVFSPFSLPYGKIFVRGMTPEEYYKELAQTEFEVGILSNAEDLIISQTINENGSRNVFRYKTREAEFRDSVVRGDENEHEEIRVFFPKHRFRNYATPNTIHERVHQIVTLTISGKKKYRFKEIDVLGTKVARELGGKIREELSNLLPRDMFEHWVNIAFPLADFEIETADFEIETASRTVPRMLVSRVNRSVCNSLSVLYACAAECLRPVIVRSIAELFASRARIAAVAFLPHHAYTKIERNFMKTHRESSEHPLPVGVHKLRRLREKSSDATSNGSRKYKIAGHISRTTVLDLMFMRSVVNAK